MFLLIWIILALISFVYLLISWMRAKRETKQRYKEMAEAAGRVERTTEEQVRYIAALCPLEEQLESECPECGGTGSGKPRYNSPDGYPCLTCGGKSQ